jgi:co-chaperonin GroES (HSP10)
MAQVSNDTKHIPTPSDGYCVVRIVKPTRSGIILPDTANSADMVNHVCVANSGRHAANGVWVESKMQPGDIALLAPSTVRVFYPQCPEDIAVVRLMDVAAYVTDPERVLQ